MKALVKALLLLLFVGVTSPAWAVRGTVQIPTCMTFLGNINNPNTYAPCNGVIPVGSDGNPIDWSTVIQGSPTSPSYTSPVVNGSAVSSSNPFPVTDASTLSTISTVGTAIPTAAQLLGAKNGSGKITPLLVDSSGILQVNCPNCTSGGSGGSAGSNTAAVAVGTDSPTYGSYTLYQGADGTARPWGGDNAGHAYVSIFGVTQVAVTNFPATQAVSVASLPLPAGAATSANQTTSNTSLATIATNTTGVATAAGQTAILNALTGPTPAGTNMIGTVGGVRVHWSESTSSLSANQTFNGLSHDDGGSINGGTTQWQSFGCFVWSDKTLTINLQASNDNNTWFTVQSQLVDAMSSYFLTQMLFTRYWRCQVVNGSTADNTLVLNATFGN